MPPKGEIHWFRFSLKLHECEFTDEVAHKLYSAGCDDALFTSDATGIYLEFTRQASCENTAIVSAIKDVVRAGYKCEVHNDSD